MVVTAILLSVFFNRVIKGCSYIGISETSDLTKNCVPRGNRTREMRSYLGFPCSAIGTFFNKLKGKRSHFAMHFKQKCLLCDNSTYLPSILISSYLL